MEMEIPFPFCVPVAAGIVSVSWETLKKQGVKGILLLGYLPYWMREGVGYPPNGN